MPQLRKQIVIKGIVQGVGFRPFVWRLAAELKCTGSVCNNTSGVMIEVQGNQVNIGEFERRLICDAPSLSRITDLQSTFVEVRHGESQFQILASAFSKCTDAAVSPDVGVCNDCLTELFAPHNRRSGYPFINCTNCGPRFTIVQSLPYDRNRTTMRGFELCPACQREYDSPSDRRFHAEPNACPNCGPQVWYVDSNSYDGPAKLSPQLQSDIESEQIRTRNVIELVQSKIAQGAIIAIKGVGGFHLVCDAKNESAIRNLRERKRRPDKPLAVMVSDLETCRTIAQLDADEERAIVSPERPIVLLRKRCADACSEELAPGNPNIGVMLAYSPLHCLLVKPGQVWVMTSGNISDEPIAIDNDDAWVRLKDIADGFLFHNRPIHAVCDDSVLQIVDSQAMPIRRSRGFAPLEIALEKTCADGQEATVLALGGELKATVCLAVESHAFVSQHIGDMGNEESLKMMEHVTDHLLGLYHAKPAAIVADLHPGYVSVAWAKRVADSKSIPLLQMQHHHAHAAALMAEHRLAPASQIIACVFDGTGFGTDGAIWGGEWLIANQFGFSRFAHLSNVPLPGGDACVLRPSRSALAQLFRYSIPWDETLQCVLTLSKTDKRLLETQLTKGIQCVETSSMGRLFDAIASLLSIRQEIHYEGQAAIELERISADAFATVSHALEPFAYCWDKNGCWELNCGDLLREVIEHWQSGVAPGLIGAMFHETISQATLDICLRARSETGINIAGLTGGVFQNALLSKLIKTRLEQNGFQLLTHRLVPPNDAGISLGQAVLARAALTLQVE